MSSPRECGVWYSVVANLLPCRFSEAHAILFLFLVFDFCLSSARRIFMLLTLAGLLLLCACEREALDMVVVGSEGRLSLSKVSWSACVHTLPFGPAARMQAVLFLPG